MNSIVLGAGGLLGTTLCALYPEVTPVYRKDCDINDPIQVYHTIEAYLPDVVINCAGIVPKATHTPEEIIRTNALAPRLLLDVCDTFGSRLVQVSTDCVFSGLAGRAYTPRDIPNPDTLYGMSKYLGEILDYPHLTIRSSFIGLPDPKGHGLLAWMKQQEHITGWNNYLWNGLTTVELAAHIMSSAVGNTGMLHIYAKEPISKGELLVLANDVLELGKEITCEELPDPPLNRTLSGGIAVTKPYETMLQELKDAIPTIEAFHEVNDGFR